jgi:cation:H+ antiporter
MINHLFVYILSFLGVWIGSGLAIKSVEKISHQLKTSSFLLSFLVLGLFTSIGELSIGISSIIKHDPEVYVGNLIGASIVIFMLIIPLLALTSKSIKIAPEFQEFNLLASLLVIALPVLSIMDGKITKIDHILALVLFIFLLVNIQRKNKFIKNLKIINQSRSKIGPEFLKIIFGIIVIFTSSHFIVDQTQYFAKIFQISPFIISLLVTSLGTNIPELSLIVRSVIMKNNEVAFGNYIGSASFNTFLLGLLGLIYNKDIVLNNNYTISLIFLLLNLTLFYFFAKSKNTISQKESLILLSTYIFFLITQIFFINTLL